MVITDKDLRLRRLEIYENGSLKSRKLQKFTVTFSSYLNQAEVSGG